MKKNSTTLLALLTAVVACQKVPQATFDGEVHYTPCSFLTKAVTSTSLQCSGTREGLMISVKNVSANCGSEPLVTSCTVQGKTITLRAKYENGPHPGYCFCHMDISCGIQNLQEGDYLLVFELPYYNCIPISLPYKVGMNYSLPDLELYFDIPAF